MTQFEMDDCEFLGAVKNDLLGLRHLDTLSAAQKIVYELNDVWLDFDGSSTPANCRESVRFDDEHFCDPEIWPQIDRGQTIGIFQLECLHEDTPVEGRPIREWFASPPAVLSSFDEAYGEVVANDVVEVYYCGEKETCEIETEDGRTVRCAITHPFLTDRGWVQAQNLTEKDELYVVD